MKTILLLLSLICTTKLYCMAPALVINLDNPTVLELIEAEKTDLVLLLANNDNDWVAEEIYTTLYIPLLEQITHGASNNLLLNAKESYKKKDCKKFIRELKQYFGIHQSD